MIIFKRNVILIVVSAILQGIWEYWVCNNFYSSEVIQNMNRLMIEATIGDVVITIVIFNFLLLLYRDNSWKLNIRNFFGIVAYSFAAALYFESRGLWLGRWEYTKEMMYLFNTNIGLLPIIQLVFLIPLTIFIENWVSNKIGIYGDH